MFEKRSTNYCWVFILPLVNLDKWSFGGDNFVNCYVSEDDRYAVVESKAPFGWLVTKSSQFRFDFVKNNLHVGVFEFPEAFKKDVEKFREGKFSQFSNEAKMIIKKKYSSLYKVPTSKGTFSTDRNLLALDKDKEWRQKIEEYFRVTDPTFKLPPDAELASIPDEDCYYKLNLSSKLEEATTC